jgi:hypothetical protein
MARRRRTDNTMARRRRTDNTMARRRRTDNTIAKEKSTNNIYKTLHIKLNIASRCPDLVCGA